MIHTGFRHEVLARISFEESELNMLVEWAECHYDGACKKMAQRLREMRAIAAHTPTYIHSFTVRELDTLSKICEMDTDRTQLRVNIRQSLIATMRESQKTETTPRPTHLPYTLTQQTQ